MNKLIKIIAVWILVFALPVQGFTAATMINCENAHSHESKSLSEGHNHGSHVGHDEASNHEASHEHVADVTNNYSIHHSSSSKHACKHCGSLCCSSTAIVASLLNLHAQFDDVKANLAYPAPQFTSYISAGIERPPRTILV